MENFTSWVNKFGENADIDTATDPEVIWSHGGSFPFLDAGIEMDIVSSDAADTLTGTGARKVKITYFDSDNIQHNIEISLNGTTEVELGDDVKIITRMQVSSVGTGKINAGEINAVDRATGATVYQSIEIGEGQTLSAVQICPADKRGKITYHYCNYARALASPGAAQMRLRKRSIDGAIQTKYNITLTQYHAKDEREYKIGGIDLSPGEIIYWECTTVLSDNTPIAGGFDIGFVEI